MRKILIGLLFFSIMALPVTAAFAQTGTQQSGQGPGAVLTTLLDAIKAKNYDLAMTYFADNATVVDNTGTAFGGSVQTHASAADIRKGFVETAPSDLQLLSVQESGNTATVTVRSTQIVGTGPGGSPLPNLTHLDFVVTATVANGKIQTATLDLTPQSRADVLAALAQTSGPGMPSTGSPDGALLPATVASIGLLLACTGAVLVRRRT